MHPIQMVDLKRQYLHIKSEVDAAIQEVIDTTSFINGKAVTEFSRNLQEYMSCKHVIPCANGTDALQIALMALGLQPGDEVITPSYTYIATTEVIALLRLKPVFVEVDPQTFCIDPEAIRKAITAKTRAIVPVHLYGQAALMEAIMQIAAEHGLFVVEDNAQAIGATYRFSDGKEKRTGTIGHIGCTSFFPSKNLGAYGDGGAIFTNDGALAERLKMIANHGQSKRYYHDMVGCNSRLDSIQAAVLNVKLNHLDNYNKARIKAADHYDQAFRDIAEIVTPFRAGYSTHVFHQYTMKLERVSRDKLHQYLSEREIPSMIYYPVPAHRQKMFEQSGYVQPKLEVTDWLTERVLSLPIHTELDEEQLQFITDNVIQFIREA